RYPMPAGAGRDGASAAAPGRTEGGSVVVMVGSRRAPVGPGGGPVASDATGATGRIRRPGQPWGGRSGQAGEPGQREAPGGEQRQEGEPHEPRGHLALLDRVADGR